MIFLGFLKDIYLIIYFLKMLIYFNTAIYYRTYILYNNIKIVVTFAVYLINLDIE